MNIQRRKDNFYLLIYVLRLCDLIVSSPTPVKDHVYNFTLHPLSFSFPSSHLLLTSHPCYTCVMKPIVGAEKTHTRARARTHTHTCSSVKTPRDQDTPTNFIPSCITLTLLKDKVETYLRESWLLRT